MPILVDEMDEFEPLFDYSRVQPNIVCLDDDDEDVVCVTKKRKNSHHVVENKKTNANPVAVVDLEDKDDDWLPSPPKVKNNLPRKNIEEDSTLKDLRLTAVYSYQT